jgi:hypothetical protein
MEISLTKGITVAGRFEEVHIYPNLKTELPLSFADENFTSAVNIAGKVHIAWPSGIDLSFVTVTARKDSHTGEVIAPLANLQFSGANAPTTSPQTSDEWIITVPQTTLPSGNSTLYWTVTAVDKNGYSYAARSETTHSGGIPEQGLTLADNLNLAIYSISVTNVTGGNITTSRSAAAQDESVTIFVLINPGYVLSGKPTVTGGSGSVTVSGTSSPYSFTMPSSDVTVGGTFHSTGKEITSFTLAGKPGYITNDTDTTGTITVTVPYGTSLTNI